MARVADRVRMAGHLVDCQLVPFFTALVVQGPCRQAAARAGTQHEAPPQVGPAGLAIAQGPTRRRASARPQDDGALGQAAAVLRGMGTGGGNDGPAAQLEGPVVAVDHRHQQPVAGRVKAAGAVEDDDLEACSLVVLAHLMHGIQCFPILEQHTLGRIDPRRTVPTGHRRGTRRAEDVDITAGEAAAALGRDGDEALRPLQVTIGPVPRHQPAAAERELGLLVVVGGAADQAAAGVDRAARLGRPAAEPQVAAQAQAAAQAQVAGHLDETGGREAQGLDQGVGRRAGPLGAEDQVAGGIAVVQRLDARGGGPALGVVAAEIDGPARPGAAASVVQAEHRAERAGGVLAQVQQGGRGDRADADLAVALVDEQLAAAVAVTQAPARPAGRVQAQGPGRLGVDKALVEIEQLLVAAVLGVGLQAQRLTVGLGDAVVGLVDRAVDQLGEVALLGDRVFLEEGLQGGTAGFGVDGHGGGSKGGRVARVKPR